MYNAWMVCVRFLATSHFRVPPKRVDKIRTGLTLTDLLDSVTLFRHAGLKPTVAAAYPFALTEHEYESVLVDPLFAKLTEYKADQAPPAIGGCHLLNSLAIALFVKPRGIPRCAQIEDEKKA